MTERVVVIQELLPKYRVPFFEGLRETLADDRVRLEVVHGHAAGERAERRDEATLPWATRVENRRLRVGGRELVWQPALKLVRGADLVVVEHANRQLANYLLLAGAAAGATPPLAFWGHGANLQARPQDRPMEALKRRTIRWPHWWFTYTRGAAQRVISAGFPADRVTVVQNSIDTSSYRSGESILRVPSRCVFLGSLHEHKRIQFLLAAAEEAHRLDATFTLLVIGDGPLRQEVERAARQQEWIQYRGALFGRQKAEAVQAAQVMLLPGLVGLAVIDSFAAGTPILTTSIDFHSPEIEYLEDGNNARSLPAETEPADYARAVVQLLADESALGRLRHGCRESAANYSLEAMVERFANGVMDSLRVAGSR